MTKETWKDIRTMLPSILVLLTAGWFTACESDDEAETGMPQETPTEVATIPAITFGGKLGEMDQVQNRAATLPLENLTEEFHLWGYKTMSHDETNGYGTYQTVIDGYTLKHTASSAGTSTDNTDDWHYVGGTSLNRETQTIKYWDFSASSYRFMAVSGATASLTHSIGLNGSDYQATIAYEGLRTDTEVWFSELWFSNNAGTPEYGKTVQLRFFSPYCKVRFMFIDEEGQPITTASKVYPHITAGSIKFYPNNAERKIGSEGDLQIAYPITGKSTEKTLRSTPTNSIDMTLPYETGNYAFASETDKEKWYTLLPDRTASAFTLEMIYNGRLRTAIVPAEYMMWDMNHEYTYVFKVTAELLSFEPQLHVYKEWQSGYTPDTPEEW